MDREQVIALQHQRFAAKKYDPNRRISQKDWEALVEVGRLAPSSVGLEPWKMLLLKNERMNSRFAQMIKNFQESDMKLNSERSLFDWASKQTYIQMANMMMAAAMLGIDSCPIEGYDQEKVEAYLEEKGYLNTAEFGVSVMASFGYRNQEITPKTRWKTEVIYEVIE